MYRLLLVEDDFLVRMIAREVLEGAGFAVLEAENAARAFDLLDRLDHVALLVTDLRMPGHHTGVHVALHARARFPQLPVIITSGFVEECLAQLGQLDPAPAMLDKPYRTEGLIQLACCLTGHAPPAR